MLDNREYKEFTLECYGELCKIILTLIRDRNSNKRSFEVNN